MKQGDKKGKSKREMEDSIQIWGGFFQYKKENISSTLNLEMIQNSEIIKLLFRINISIKSLIALFILLHSQMGRSGVLCWLVQNKDGVTNILTQYEKLGP